MENGHFSMLNRLYNEAIVYYHQSIYCSIREDGTGTRKTSKQYARELFMEIQITTIEHLQDILKTGSYLRIKNVSLTYNIPTDFGKDKVFDYAKVYLSGQNLFTFTKYNGFDPEVSTNGIDNNIYPVTRIISLGLNVGF
jgi:hypothetical protein